MGWRLKAVAEPLIVCTHAQTPRRFWRPRKIAPEELERCRALGEAMAAGLALGGVLNAWVWFRAGSRWR